MAEKIPPFPQSWYPICRSTDLKRGQVIRQQAFGIPLAVYRTGQGHVAAMSAICCHMGADLTRGKVVGEHLQCRLHRWEFDVNGVCKNIGVDSPIPARARQNCFVAREYYGLVFVFLGGEPAFDLPQFDIPSPVWSSAYAQTFDVPYQVVIANAYDEQHFGPVHHRQFLEAPALTSTSPYHFCMRFRARVIGQHLSDVITRVIGMQDVDITLHCWGGNTILVYNQGTSARIFVSTLPEDEKHSRIFIVTVAGKPHNFFHAITRRVMLRIARQLTIAFLSPDIYVLRGMDFNPTVLLPEADHTFIEWVKYWKSLPRETVHA